MKVYLSIGISLLLLNFGSPSWAEEEPAAIVENYSGKLTTIQFLDVLRHGRKINLGPDDQLIIGYFHSCIKETIFGGQIIIGRQQSSVIGGKATRERVECDGGNLQRITTGNSSSAVTVFRTKKNAQQRLPKSQLTIFSTIPFISLSAKDLTIKIRRLDKSEKPRVIHVAGSTSDFSKHGIQLSPGALYHIQAGQKGLIFSTDPLAENKSLSILQRFIKL
jgi:hypothetical protein